MVAGVSGSAGADVTAGSSGSSGSSGSVVPPAASAVDVGAEVTGWRSVVDAATVVAGALGVAVASISSNSSPSRSWARAVSRPVPQSW